MKAGANVAGCALGILLCASVWATPSFAQPKSMGAVITGRVVTSAGEPVVDVSVRLMQWVDSTAATGRSLIATPLRSRSTDDRGIYRFFDVPSGDYVVMTSAEREIADGPPPDRSAESLPVVRRDDVERVLRGETLPAPPAAHMRLVPTFYPSALHDADAWVISAAPGDEVANIDIVVRAARTVAVSGRVLNWDPGLGELRIGLEWLRGYSRVTRSADVMFPRPSTDGGFAFADVFPGQYVVTARVTGSAGDLIGRADLVVDDADVSGVAITLRPAIVVAGVVRYEDAPSGSSHATFALARVDPPSVFSPRAVVVGPDARFAERVTVPGSYLVTTRSVISSQGQSWWLKSAMLNGQDAADVPVDMSSDVSGLVVTFSRQPSAVSGTISAPNGSPNCCTVVVFSADRRFWNASGRRTVVRSVQAGGKYSTGDLPAGEYFVAAIDLLVPNRTVAPEYLERLISEGAVKVSLGEGEQKALDLSLAPGTTAR